MGRGIDALTMALDGLLNAMGPPPTGLELDKMGGLPNPLAPTGGGR